MEGRKEEYLGDGVYAEFTGYSVILKANDPRNPTDEVHLERNTLDALIMFAEDHKFIRRFAE